MRTFERIEETKKRKKKKRDEETAKIKVKMIRVREPGNQMEVDAASLQQEELQDEEVLEENGSKMELAEINSKLTQMKF